MIYSTDADRASDFILELGKISHSNWLPIAKFLIANPKALKMEYARELYAEAIMALQNNPETPSVGAARRAERFLQLAIILRICVEEGARGEKAIKDTVYHTICQPNRAVYRRRAIIVDEERWRVRRLATLMGTINQTVPEEARKGVELVVQLSSVTGDRIRMPPEARMSREARDALEKMTRDKPVREAVETGSLGNVNTVLRTRQRVCGEKIVNILQEACIPASYEEASTKC